MRKTLIDLVDPLELVEAPDWISMTKNQDQITNQEEEDTEIGTQVEKEIIVTGATAEKDQEEKELKGIRKTTMGVGPEGLARRPNVLGGVSCRRPHR